MSVVAGGIAPAGQLGTGRGSHASNASPPGLVLELWSWGPRPLFPPLLADFDPPGCRSRPGRVAALRSDGCSGSIPRGTGREHQRDPAVAGAPVDDRARRVRGHDGGLLV